MEKLWILLALSLVAADKLDRTYLPPPDAQYSGGNPEELQIPLEFPKKESKSTSIIPTVAPDNGLIRSGYYIGTTLGPNIGKNIDTSSIHSTQTYFSNTSPTLFTYTPTISPGFGYETTNRPLAISQDHAHIQDQQGNQNDGDSLLSSPTLSTSTRFSQRPGLDNQYLVAHGQSKYTEPKKIIELRKYVGQNLKILDSKTTNTNNQVNFKYDQNNPLFYNQEMVVNNPDYTAENLMPIINNYASKGNVRPGQYAQNAKIMVNYLNSYIMREQNKLNSIVSTSNLKPKPGNVDLRSSIFSKKPTPLTSNNRITPSRTEIHPRRPQAKLETNAVTLNYHNVITPEGYSYNYDTSNGISANESGTTNNGVRAQGAYSYTGDDGKVYRVVYTADENGFQPRGDHIPLLPVVIQRLIEKAAREQEAGVTDDGSYDETKYGYKKYQGVMERYDAEFQGFTNNRRNKFGGYSRKSFKGENIGRPIATIPKTSRNEYNNNKQNANQDESNIPSLENRVRDSLNDGSENYKPLDIGIAKFVVPQKFIGEAIDNKIRPSFLEESQKPNDLAKENITQTLLQVLPIQQGERAVSGPINFVKIPAVFNSKQTSDLNKNIPEIIANYNAYTEKEQRNLGNKPNGYFYNKPQKKIIENTNKERVLFNTDHELEIGDDDIITISVPVPNTTIHPGNESSKIYQYGNVVIQPNVNTNQKFKPELSVIPIYTVDSITPSSSDVSSEANQPSFKSKGEFVTTVNPNREGSSIEKNSDNFQQPHTLIVQDFKAGPKTPEGAYGTLIDGNIYDTPSSRGFYEQNQNKDLPKTLDIAYTKYLAKDDDNNVSNGGDIRSDYFDSLTKHDQLDTRTNIK